MKNSESEDLAEPLFFAVLEVLSFVFGFSTMLLLPAAAESGWITLALWRGISLAGVLFLGAYGTFERPLNKLRFLGKAALYSLPFWVSSVFFPLGRGQSNYATRALFLYLGLTFLLFCLSEFKRQWLPSLLTGLTFWALNPTPSWSWLECISLSPLLLLLWPRESRAEDSRFSIILLLSASSSWAFAIYLSRVGESLVLESLARALLVWSLLVMVSSLFLLSCYWEEKHRSARREVDFSVPDLAAALSWLRKQSLLKQGLPWFLLLLAFAFDPESWPMIVAALLAIPGLLALSCRFSLSQNMLAWWCCWQFFIMWGIAETSGLGKTLWILVQLLSSLYLQSRRDQTPVFIETRNRELETSLSGLLAPAPPGLRQRIMAQNESSVEIEVSLNAEAPKGFRARLLERLRSESGAKDEN